jgi:N-acetylneuraminic acid mutarotase
LPIRHYLGFSVDNIGFAASDSAFYRYNLQQDTWDSIGKFPFLFPLMSFKFEINSKIYFGTGMNHDYSISSSFYRFDHLNQTFNRLSDFPISTSGGVGFAINGYGYAGLGESSSKTIYKYDQSFDKWEPVSQYPGNSNRSLIVFTLGGKAYLGFGQGIRYPFTYVQNEFFEFDPAYLE